MIDFKKIILLTFAVLSALACAEIFLRLQEEQTNPWFIFHESNLIRSDKLLYERPPNIDWTGPAQGDLAALEGWVEPNTDTVTFQTDEEGFRNGKLVKNPQIAFIGDSYTEAGNINEEHTFVQLVSKQSGFTVRNLGRSGFSPSQELLILKKYVLAAETKPQIVVWQLAQSNDLSDELGVIQWEKTGELPFHMKPDLSAYSIRLFGLVGNLVRKIAKEQGKLTFEGTFTGKGETKQQVRFLQARSHEQIALDHPGWPRLEQALIEGKRLCDEAGIRLILLFMPMKHEVLKSNTHFETSVQNILDQIPRFDESIMFRNYIYQLSGQQGIELIDATDVLRNAANKGNLPFQPNDTHLNRLGHQIVARHLIKPN